MLYRLSSYLSSPILSRSLMPSSLPVHRCVAYSFTACGFALNSWGKQNHDIKPYEELRDGLFLHASFLYPFKCTYMWEKNV